MNKAFIATGLAAAGTGLYYATSDSTYWGDIAIQVDSVFGGLYQENQKHNEDEAIYANYLSQYGKQYDTQDEYNLRFNIFRDHLVDLERMNSEHPDSVNMNKFSDWTKDEIKKFRSKKLLDRKSERGHPMVEYTPPSYTVLDTKNMPSSINWVESVMKRDPYAVIPMRNQEECGSCWGFTAAAAIEFYNWEAGGDFVKLSVQQLLDCDRDGKYGNMGCEGGNADLAFEYTAENALAQSSYYPYDYHGVKEKDIEEWECEITASPGNIKGNKVKTSSKIHYMKPRDADQMKAALAQGVVVVSLDADSDDFMYHSGINPIVSKKCGTDVGHAVLAVGYGYNERYDTDYIIIKNSYGDDWGDQGYGKISLSQKYNSLGVCAILNEGMWTTVENPIKAGVAK